ncbi:4'-phosphopantetheine phosphatase-like [Tubulanus polymorphus]|uniref:4'-phosphopantetheine phosphatase-like n=1 Tax=Tubulanus polymorphus TaxID=672921 RepID=UPI003DA58663
MRCSQDMSGESELFCPESVEWPGLRVPCGSIVVAIDIGCSLIKLCHLVDDLCTGKNAAADLQEPCIHCEKQEIGSNVRMNFISLKNSDIEKCMQYIKQLMETTRKKPVIIGLGVGTLKHRERIKSELRVELQESDEFKCFAKAFHSILENQQLAASFVLPSVDPVIDHRQFGLAQPTPDNSQTNDDQADEIFPAILCVLGSTANFLKIDADGSYTYLHNVKRCGVFFYSLGKILTGCETYEELMSLTREGHAPNLTICLDEILTEKYGDVDGVRLSKSLQSLDFRAETLPFGRLIKDDSLKPTREDMARALLHTVADGVMDVAVLLAKETRLRRVYFAGSFLRENFPARDYLSQMPYASMNRWMVNARFLRHDGYIGVMGAVLNCVGSQ